MISAIITAFKEPDTIGKAIVSISEQLDKKDEIIVIAPDDETLNAAKKTKIKNLVTMKDKGEGKPAAMNLLIGKVKGDILIFTDGDVSVGKDSIAPMLDMLENDDIGAVTGRPVSINDTNDKFGFWAYVLTQIANERRQRAYQENKRFFCSGYLFAIRKGLFRKIPEDLLSEDGFISHNVYLSGKRIAYSPKSEVFVKYPNNFKDWIKQKKRSAGGYNQIRKMVNVEIRSFKSESSGAFAFIKHAKTIKQMYWLFSLFLARVYLWAVIYRDINIKKKSQREIWERVESTK